MKSATVLPSHYLRQLVLENVSDIIVATDLDFCVQSWNHIAEKFYGKTAEEAIGKRMSELVTFSYPNASAEEALKQLQTKKIWKGEVSVVAPNGETCYFLQTVKYVLNEEDIAVGVMAVGRNITERKKAEEQLARSEQFYRALIANATDVTLLVNTDGIISFASPSITKLLGYETEEAIGANVFAYVHPDDLKNAFSSFKKEVEEEADVKYIVARLRRKNGDWLWCMARGNNQLRTPAVNAIVLYLQDYTQRKQATDALKESEKRFRKLMQELQTGVLLMNTEGRIEMVNNEALRMFDMQEKDTIGHKIFELCDDAVHEDGRLFLISERPTHVAVQTQKLVKDVVMGVWNKHRKERRWLLVSADPVEDNEGRLQSVISTFTDITERKKQEKRTVAEKLAYQRQIAQATIDGQEKERLEVGRELHDNVGQQLTSIKLFLDLAKTTTNDETRKILETALRSVSAVIDEVRFMSRSLVPPTLKDLGLIDSVNDLVESLRATQPMDFELTYIDLDEDRLPDNKKLALFRIIQEQLNNVLKYAAAKKVSLVLRSLGNHVLLEITDDGVGFDLAQIRRGIGLTNIINRSELFGGRVEINTAPGQGCNLKVWLPYSAANATVE